jgi:putative endonuclease
LRNLKWDKDPATPEVASSSLVVPATEFEKPISFEMGFFVDRLGFCPYTNLMPYFVYIIRSVKDGTYPTGSTQNLHARLERHNEGRAKYTRSKHLWKLVYKEEHSDRSSTVKREQELKGHKKKTFIENLIRRCRP